VKTKLTVLLADDDEVDRIAVRRALPKSVTVIEARDARAAEAVLRERRVDLVLLDYFLPPDTGPAVLARLQSAQPGVPCIFLSGHGSEEIAVEAMKAGAEDYLPKSAVAEPRRLAQLVERTYAANQLRLQVQREQARFALALEASGAAPGAPRAIPSRSPAKSTSASCSLCPRARIGRCSSGFPASSLTTRSASRSRSRRARCSCRPSSPEIADAGSSCAAAASWASDTSARCST